MSCGCAQQQQRKKKLKISLLKYTLSTCKGYSVIIFKTIFFLLFLPSTENIMEFFWIYRMTRADIHLWIAFKERIWRLPNYSILCWKFWINSREIKPITYIQTLQRIKRIYRVPLLFAVHVHIWKFEIQCYDNHFNIVSAQELYLNYGCFFCFEKVLLWICHEKMYKWNKNLNINVYHFKEKTMLLKTSTRFVEFALISLWKKVLWFFFSCCSACLDSE